MNISFILHKLGNHIIKKNIGFTDLEEILSIILLKNQSSLPKNHFYISDRTTSLRLLQTTSTAHPITIFLAISPYQKKDCVDFDLYHQHNIIQTDLELIDLYNCLNFIIEDYKYWCYSLMQAICDRKTLSQIVELATSMINSLIFILDHDYRVLCGSDREDHLDDYSDEMFKNGSFSFQPTERLEELFETNLEDNNYKLYYSPDTGHYHHFYKMVYNDIVIAVILFISTSYNSSLDLYYYILDFSKIIKSLVVDLQMNMVERDAACATFFSDVVEGNLHKSTEFDLRLKLLPYSLNSFLSCIVIRFDPSQNKENIPYPHIISELEKIFIRVNITVYRNDIILMYSQNERTFSKLEFDYEQFNALLIRYNAHAGISNASRNHSMLRTLYLIASDTIDLSYSLGHYKLSNRIFSYEEYSFYYIINLCAQSFIRQHHHDDLGYLIHPSVIALYRYDQKHHTNLRDVLFHYLVNGKSISKTAKVMYMHRNTVINKLNKINNIIMIPLDDGYFQSRLILSCLIVHYHENYMNSKLQL
ncbi:PucR family transcriptional regulator [Geosporobacter ferrireducens]|uniref:PucR C-terminal helix-turn-helix domain-containing protein n=1 Tax=Geosporobacter ferrireducens TaxID=1424294 RepID=A0A1D8GFZ6_9FIRM|nr:helix-turn-helix domain-containing protein [Geosporobacter ferrireducens]AOT69822.1 hypothetical protein Gferi_09660 [Geosporobacter ferrireducens]